ncbi:hypothetical protein ACA910_014767 [Epithemia clementina (nom. ined.)]
MWSRPINAVLLFSCAAVYLWFTNTAVLTAAMNSRQQLEQDNSDVSKTTSTKLLDRLYLRRLHEIESSSSLSSVFGISSSPIMPFPHGADGENKEETLGPEDDVIPCGQVGCFRGEVCCSESCGMCSKPGEACIQMHCGA